MTLSSPTVERSREAQRSKLDALLPRRPRRPRTVLPRLAEGAVPDLAAARLAGRRGLLGVLGGGALGSLGPPERAPHRDPLLTLVSRITQGFELAEYERAKAMGYHAYLEEQLAPETIDDFEMDARMASYASLAMSPKELYTAYSADYTLPYYEFKRAALQRSVHSKRQLFERMCEFWNDHFSIDQNKADFEWVFMPDNERLVIRPHALGSFPAMLSASAHNGAMLFYLDNWLNVRGAPQENYARELLELHTLGVHGGYNESDVKEVAKCFTGWTLQPDFNSSDWLRGVFDVAQHTLGQKFVLGSVIDNSPPRDDAKKVLDLLAAHPSTADFLARKLIRWFLTPTPPQALVDQVAATYLSTNGDIKAMLRVILARENMRWASPLVGPKLRRPFHYVVSLLRTLGADVSDALYPIFFLYGMGHVPFDHVQPNGYPDTAEAWGSSLLPRWDFASQLLANVLGPPFPGVSLSFTALKAKLGYATASDRPGLATRMNERLYGATLSPHEVEVLQQFIDATPSFGGTAFYESLALGASMPGFQWY